MGPLRAGQELRSCQRVGLMAVKPTHAATVASPRPRPQGPMASSCWRP